MSQLTTAEAAKMLGIADATLNEWRIRGEGPAYAKWADSFAIWSMKSRGISVNAQSKHPTERGLREKNGKWEYRFNLNGQPYSRVADLEAVPEDIVKAHAERTAHIEELRKG